MRGYFGIGIENGKCPMNIGTLWRSASVFGAAFIFTVGKRYKQQGSDVWNSWKQIPLYHYETYGEFYKAIPYDCMLVGIEIDVRSIPIQSFSHPERAVYILGAEDHGLSNESKKKCHRFVQLPGERCLNVATAGSLMMYDRYTKGIK